MTETSRATLRRLLLAGYEDLRKRLTRRLGSSELASEALQDTFLRLERVNPAGPLNNPRGYLLRMALNIATNRRLAESRHLTTGETDAVLQVADGAPDPERSAELRSEIDVMKLALAELPTRCREIFLASWLHEVPHAELAARFGVSVRTIQIELKRALEHCALRLGRPKRNDFVSPRRRLSR